VCGKTARTVGTGGLVAEPLLLQQLSVTKLYQCAIRVSTSRCCCANERSPCCLARSKGGTVNPRDEFSSEEDLDIANLSDAELAAWWLQWLHLAQATNDLDEGAYSHGVFTWDPAVPRNGVSPG
jgi:hypothetical protein